MNMLKNIVCATDGSAHGDKAVVLAAEIAKMTGGAITICTVNQLTGGLRGPPIYLHETAEVKSILDKAAELARKTGAKEVHEVELDGRDVPAAIVTYANRVQSDHIVTGTGDKHGVSRLMLGSVAAAVASTASCPVTVAR
jgi:nucleotide-binding universal stress UspA family protein